jgi:hypothetical protein
LAVQRLARGCDGKAGGESGSTELGSSTARGEDGANSNVFDEAGINLGACKESSEGAVEEVGSLSVFEAAFSALGDGRAESACYDNLRKQSVQQSVCLFVAVQLRRTHCPLVSRLRCERVDLSRTYIIRVLFQQTRSPFLAG